MPPRRFSRHSFTTSTLDSSNREFLSRRDKFFYRELPDNVFHVVKEGDTLQNLAGRFYSSLSGANGVEFSPAQLWWVIADFQPAPIHDPTIKLVVGATLVVPSLRTVRERIFNTAERRRIG